VWERWENREKEVRNGSTISFYCKEQQTSLTSILKYRLWRICYYLYLHYNIIPIPYSTHMKS